MRTLAALVAGAALTMVFVMGPTASAQSSETQQAKCASVGLLSLVNNMNPTGMAWEVIRPDEAKYFHISPCSIILDGVLHNGQRPSMVITPNLRIVVKS